jgi:hypothetical protein
VITTGPIGRAPAQRLAREELSKAVYHQTSIPQLINKYLGLFLGRIFTDASRVTPGGWWTVVALTGLAVLIVATIVIRLGPLARSARRTTALLEPGADPLTAGQLRDLAAASATEGNYSTAILQRLRAIAAGCEERGILLPDAGRTADELAARAGEEFPGHAADLVIAARLFDQVRYGGDTGTRDGYELLRALDVALTQQMPSQAVAQAVASGAPS